eukprot:Nk52_evm15s2118 gene=Nk52_evmTU15s2118
MIITSDDVNFIIYRYLLESGFQHSAFAFGHEGNLFKTNINNSDVPVGCLLSVIQKGLQYLEAELKVTDPSGSSLNGEPLTLLAPAVCNLISKGIELKDVKRAEREREKEKRERARNSKSESGMKREDMSSNAAKREAKRMKREKDDVDMEMDDYSTSATKQRDRSSVADGAAGPAGGKNSDGSAVSTNAGGDGGALVLRGHEGEVFTCSWNPVSDILASGSGDSTARIWAIPERENSSALVNGEKNGSSLDGEVKTTVLRHLTADGENSKDVTTLDWNSSGTLLATGNYDGSARLWTQDGELKHTLSEHTMPVFSLKWNRKCDMLVSGSVDKSAIVWDTTSGTIKQKFSFHSAPVLDVDWRNNTSFASCSTDKKIIVCKLGETDPVKTFEGHTLEVNAIRWDGTGLLLASCSDDKTAKIWSLKQDTFVHNFTEHEKEIYTLKWRPNTSPEPSYLATASFDNTVRLWDAEKGVCHSVLSAHSAPVYSVAYSPDGKYLASGSIDKMVHVWSVKEGKVVKSYRGDGGVFEVCWNSRGDRVAAGLSNKCLSVFDFRM